MHGICSRCRGLVLAPLAGPGALAWSWILRLGAGPGVECWSWSRGLLVLWPMAGILSWSLRLDSVLCSCFLPVPRFLRASMSTGAAAGAGDWVVVLEPGFGPGAAGWNVVVEPRSGPGAGDWDLVLEPRPGHWSWSHGCSWSNWSWSPGLVLRPMPGTWS